MNWFPFVLSPRFPFVTRRRKEPQISPIESVQIAAKIALNDKFGKFAIGSCPPKAPKPEVSKWDIERAKMRWQKKRKRIRQAKKRYK